MVLLVLLMVLLVIVSLLWFYLCFTGSIDDFLVRRVVHVHDMVAHAPG